MRSGFVDNHVVASDGSLVDVFVTLLRGLFMVVAGNKRLEFSQRTCLTYNLLISRSTAKGTRGAS